MGGMAIEVFMPKMSDHMEAGELVEWLVEEGGRVEVGQPIAEVMTDKAVAELEAPASGILKGIRPGAEVGAIVPIGETIAFIAAPDEPVPPLPPLATQARMMQEQTPRPASRQMGSGQVRATPVARRLARELGVDLAQVRGSGPGGRIREEDVRRYADAGTAAPTPQPDEAEWLELTPIQRRTGERMLESIQTAPQFALTVSADMTNALSWRDAVMEHVVATTGTRLSLTAILVKVVAAALRQYPRANASFEEGRIKVHRYVHVGVVMGTEEELVVPVIQNADQKPLAQINRELVSLRKKAQRMCLSTEELSGGTFTISNLGMYGVDHFTAILNPPQSGILAVGRIIKTPVGMADDTVALRPMMALTLTIDHRAMDGLQGVRFLAEVRQRLEQPYLMML
jgi:pyruvate dehydrogenase E2 component (dihydrolipoamide acetyltransferase)